MELQLCISPFLKLEMFRILSGKQLAKCQNPFSPLKFGFRIGPFFLFVSLVYKIGYYA